MSISRHGEAQVRSYSVTHPPGEVVSPTRPGWDHLVFAAAGLFTAHAGSGSWTIPAHRALWVPDGTTLRIEASRRTAIRCLYLDASLALVRSGVRVLHLTPLCRQLVAHAVQAAPLDLERAADRALVTVLADQLGRERGVPLHLPFPVEATARQVAAAVVADPATGLDHHVRSVAASRRTLERRFGAETGMSLGRWRRRARILAAVRMLAEGETVTAVAVRVGYASPSSFVAAFRAELDATPRRFLRELEHPDR